MNTCITIGFLSLHGGKHSRVIFNVTGRSILILKRIVKTSFLCSVVIVYNRSFYYEVSFFMGNLMNGTPIVKYFPPYI